MKVKCIYRIKLTKRYKKDIRRLKEAGRDFSRLESIVNRLAAGEPLPSACHDHVLKGRLQGIRECHIGPDWLLLYAKDEAYLILLLIRTGDHRRVLGVE